MKLSIEKITFPFLTPFAITGYTFTAANTVRVTLEDKGVVGRGEAQGIYYLDETPDSMVAQLNAIAGELNGNTQPQDLLQLLPRGGARNALDCALWDLRLKQAKQTIWQYLSAKSNLALKPKPLSTVYTLGIDTPEAMAANAQRVAGFTHLKIKLDNQEPIAKLEAIRAARPEVHMIIDVNQGWTFDELKSYTPAAAKLGVAMIEQPLPRGGDEALEGFKSPVPLGADESCLDSHEYETLKQRYDVINIKLDKCGGLTEAFNIIELAKRDNKGLMVGNMGGSSLAMAPSFVVGQHCQFVDIDGPLLLKNDIDNGLQYSDAGVVSAPQPALWG